MRPFLIPTLMALLVCALALLSLAVTPGDGARALPTSTNPHIGDMAGWQLHSAIPSVTVPDPGSVDVTAAPTLSPILPVGSDEPSARPTSKPRHAVGTPPLAGWASHYWNGAGFYAAAGPDLRRAIGSGWRNHAVVVTAFVNGQARSVSLALTDWCLCTRTPDRIIDLSDDSFVRICGALSLGVCRVEVQWP